ncbi:MAG: VRR-NUC domain-containing protein [Pseudomonadota bacterium]
MPVLEPQQAPPPQYYADNLLAVVLHIERYQHSLMGPLGSRLIDTLKGLSSDGLRLFARLLMRSTPVIRTDSLHYAEIEDPQAALAELEHRDLIESQAPVPADALLARLKTAEIRELFAQRLPEPPPRQTTKARLVATLLSQFDDAEICRHAATQFGWLRLTAADAVAELRLIYFGDEYRDFTEFVMRDLGITAFETYDFDTASHAFADPAEQGRYRELTQLARLPLARRASALDWLLSACRDGRYAGRALERRRDRLLIAWGRDFERLEADTFALGCFQHAYLHPAREREVRTRKRRGEDVTALLETLRTQPRSAEERLFAERFGRRSAAVWPETQWRSLTPKVERVEARVASLLTANGGQAWHVENALLPTLLALAFWPVLFAPVEGMFTHPFQRGPRDLFWPDFRSRRAAAIDTRFDELAAPGALWRAIGETARDKWGYACALVHWRRDLPQLLDIAQRCMTPGRLLAVFDTMLDDLAQARSGLPDLFVYYGAGERERFEFVEVKGPGDSLQPNQRVWLERLISQGLPCRVLRLRHYKPPRQARGA